jgi:hypothetical protein
MARYNCTPNGPRPESYVEDFEVCLSFLSVCLLVCLSVHLSVCFEICVSVCLSVCLYVFLLVQLNLGLYLIWRILRLD